MRNFVSLYQGGGLEEFVEGAKSARHDHDCTRVFEKHNLAYKEVIKIERNVDVRIMALFKW